MARPGAAPPALAFLLLVGIGTAALRFVPVTHAQAPASSAPRGTEAEARALCSVCHLFPPPDILPKYAWRDEIARMSLIRSNQPQPVGPAGTSGRLTLLPEDFSRVLAYYERTAPEHLAHPAPWPAADPLKFVRRPMNPT